MPRTKFYSCNRQKLLLVKDSHAGVSCLFAESETISGQMRIYWRVRPWTLGTPAREGVNRALNINFLNFQFSHVQIICIKWNWSARQFVSVRWAFLTLHASIFLHQAKWFMLDFPLFDADNVAKILQLRSGKCTLTLPLEMLQIDSLLSITLSSSCIENLHRMLSVYDPKDISAA